MLRKFSDIKGFALAALGGFVVQIKEPWAAQALAKRSVKLVGSRNFSE